MNLSLISSLQNKFVQSKDDITMKEAKTNWLSEVDERKKINNLLKYLDDLLPQHLDLETASKLIDNNIFSETEEYLEKASLYCNDPSKLGQIYFLTARCCHGMDLLEQALQYIEKALEYQPNNCDYWNLQADCLLELGEWQEAVAVLNKYLRSSPGDSEAIYRLGSIFLFYGEYAEALNCFSGCCKLKPYNSDFWEMKAEMLVKLNQISVAAQCFHKAIIFGGSLHLLSRLAYCYAKMGQLIKAKKLLLKVLKSVPDDYDALYNLGGINNKLNNNEQAYKLLKKAHTINGNDPLLLNNLGYVCFRLGRSRKAIEYYKEALKMNSSDQIILYNLASCLYEKGLWEEAETALEKIVSFDKNNSDAWVLLGNVHEQLLRPKKAVDCYNQSLGLA